MSNITTKFDVNDEVYVVISEIFPDTCLDASELFENAMNCIIHTHVDSILITNNKQVQYKLFDFDNDVAEKYMYKTEKEAFQAVMNDTIKKCEDALGYAKAITENVLKDFDKAVAELK